MKNLGVVCDINQKGELLVRGNSPHNPGTSVFDTRKKMVGNVLRTFGPIKSPYLLVRVRGIPESEKIQLLKTELYYK